MSREQEIVKKITSLVNEEFAGDYAKAFTFYDLDKDGKLSRQELTRLLVDSGIGNRVTRWLYISGIIDTLDTDKDGFLTFQEFETHIMR